MKFDVVIIGGGLAGLTAGIDLTANGKRVAIISAGQSSLHFSSGSFELLGYDRHGVPVERPLDAIGQLDADHPYRRIGMDSIMKNVDKVAPMLEKAGIAVVGSHERNHWRITPMGVFKNAWLSVADYLPLESRDKLPWRKVALINLKGFLDFYPRFIAAGLEPRGVECEIKTVSVKSLDDQRVSATEMRATNIARVLHGEALDQLAKEINAAAGDVDAILFPAVTSFEEMNEMRRLKELVKKPIHFMATMGTSVPGVRTQIRLQKYLRKLGGFYMIGDAVIRGKFTGTRLDAIQTVNFGDDLLEADNFIFAAGSFFSHGLQATPDKIVEPIFDLDVPAPTVRAEWFDTDLFKPQPYMRYGVATDGDFRALRDDKPIDNLYVVGAALGGAESLIEGSGAGVATLSALHVTDKIKA